MRHRTLLAATLASCIFACGPGEDADPDSGAVDALADGSGDVGETDADATGEEVDVAEPIDPVEAVLSVAETGRWTVPGLQGDVHVLRTEGDVPHIYASTEHDLYLAAGFEMARARFFEFELGSRLGLGTLSELIGDLVLEADMDSRGTGLTWVANRIADGMDPEAAAIVDAYAAGINAWVDLAKAGAIAAPTELELVGPLLGVADATSILRHVDRRSVAGFAAVAVYNSSFSTNDLVRDAVAAQIPGHFDGAPHGDLRQAGLVEDIWAPVGPVHDVGSTPGWGLNGSADKQLEPPRAATARVPTSFGLPEGMRARHARAAQRWARRSRHGGSDHGSNVWAVAGSASHDGAALLAGDGHLALGLPPVFFQMGLNDTVFGSGQTHQSGLYLPGFPLLAVGTNGRVAWSQTYPRADVTDWYYEEIRLDDDGYPAESLFDGDWRAMTRVDETYRIAGVLGGDATEQTWPRWTTFDGRWLTDIEGEEVDPDEALAAGEAVVTMLGTYVVPADLDGDGVVAAVSLDYTGFDVGDLLGAVSRLVSAEDVSEFQDAPRGFVGYAQNLGAADVLGGVQFTSYTATPCRGYLERTDSGEFADGAHPNRLIDGRRYGGFEIPTDDQGRPIEGDPDPQRCVVPFDEWPRAVDPASGYVANANNDPGRIATDGRMEDDPHWIGGPWDPGFRAARITGRLRAAIEGGGASVDDMVAIQADHHSMVGELFAQELVTVLSAAADADVDAAAAEGRLAAIYAERPGAFAEVQSRIEAWIDAGLTAASGVETFYDAPDEADRADAVATMIFNAWFRAFVDAVFGDEDIAFVFAPDGWDRTVVLGSLDRMVRGRGPDNPLGLASWFAGTGESIFFDRRDTPAVETYAEMVLDALAAALDALTAENHRPGVGGFGTDDMSTWLWGLRHQVRFESILVGFASGNPLIEILAEDFSITTGRLPLAPNLGAGDPRFGVRWFPRPGDLMGVDAGSPEFFDDDFDYVNGPVMRMVIRLDEGDIGGWNIVPGGQSGIADSPFFDDQAALWLGNDALPLRYEVRDVVAGALGREVLTP